MRPTLFHWRGHTLHSYPALLYVGLVLGVFADNLASHAARINSLRTFAATLILIPCGLLGARLAYVAAHWSRYRRQNLRQIWNRNQGGAGHYGGLAVGLLFSVPLLKVFHVPLGAFWDAAVFGLLFLLFFGRIGCLLHGCCCGRSYQGWGSAYLPDHQGQWRRRFPTQLLEIAWAAVLLLTASALWPRMLFPGALFLAMASLYAFGRIFLLATREELEESRLLAHYVFSLLLLVASLSTLTVRWPK
jgi:phosphatidylglycerol:prolipoprotein diacylglycerol transferase